MKKAKQSATLDSERDQRVSRLKKLSFGPTSFFGRMSAPQSPAPNQDSLPQDDYSLFIGDPPTPEEEEGITLPRGFGLPYFYDLGQRKFFVNVKPGKKHYGRYVNNLSNTHLSILENGSGRGMDEALQDFELLISDEKYKARIDELMKSPESAEKINKIKGKISATPDEQSPQSSGQQPTSRPMIGEVPASLAAAYKIPESAGSDPASIIRSLFSQAGLAGMADAAIINAWHESRLKPSAVGDGGKSIGLFQLHENGAGRELAAQRRITAEGIEDPRMDPAQNTLAIIKEVNFRRNEASPGFPSINQALSLGASIPELTGLFCYYVERPADRIGDANERARTAMSKFSLNKNQSGQQVNMFGQVYNGGDLFPMYKPKGMENSTATNSSYNSSNDRLIKIASLNISLGNSKIFEDTIISLAKSKNVPTNKALWGRAKAAAKAKFDVYPSAYANLFASRWYKEHGGGWRKSKKSKSNKAEDQMSVGSLSKLEEDTSWLKENMSDIPESEVPEWVEYLISQVARDMSHVLEYMKHRNESDGKMYVAQLSMVNKAAATLKDVMKVLSEEEVPEWVESLIADMASDIGHVQSYIEHGHHSKKASRIMDPLHYFEIKWGNYISKDFFFKKESYYKDSGLGRWLRERWVDISRKDKSGRYAPCGRSEGKPGAYPKCRPSKRVSKNTPKTTKEMTSKEKKSAISQKRRKQRKRKIETKGQKPIVDSHLKKD